MRPRSRSGRAGSGAGRVRLAGWRVDETYVKVRHQWMYLYRAVDKLKNTLDFYLSPTGAKHFLGKALNSVKDWKKPSAINSDKAPTHAAALAKLEQQGSCPEGTQHRQVKYLNKIIEADQGKLKQLIQPVRGFKTLKTAHTTIKGFEVSACSARGRGRPSTLLAKSAAARIVERAFGLGVYALAEAVQFLDAGFQVEAA